MNRFTNDALLLLRAVMDRQCRAPDTKIRGNLPNDPKVATEFKDVFEGKIGSATEKPGRGRGLPRMKRDVDDSSLVDLHILTSDVAGSVASLDFTSVGQSLNGTAFRWQVGQEGGER